MKILDEDLKLCKSKTDDGEQLVWLPLEEIALQGDISNAVSSQST